VQLNQKIYNSLDEASKEGSASVKESIEFELQKFRELGKDFYNESERKNI
jgi:hypothetical protein